LAQLSGLGVDDPPEVPTKSSARRFLLKESMTQAAFLAESGKT
jgi:hypothetical protein